jgi:hypothetical protein
MTAERFRALDGIGFVWNAKDASWKERFQQLREYKAQFTNCLAPSRYAANPKLGKWVSTRRTQCKMYQEGKPSPMTAERFRALDGIGFDWARNCTKQYYLSTL